MTLPMTAPPLLASVISADLLWWANLANIAYPLDGTPEDQLEAQCRVRVAEAGAEFVGWFRDKATDTTAYAALHLIDGKMGVSVNSKGTNSFTDMFEDADIFTVPFEILPGRPRVHGGIYKAANSILPQVIVCLNDVCSGKLASSGPDIPVVFNGHSLGGGISTHFAIYFAVTRPLWAIRERTFGSPRFGLKDFRKAHNALVKDVIRLVHAEDVIPKVPAFDYHHVAGRLHITSDGRVIGAVHGWLRRLFGFERALVDDIDGEGLKDHFLAAYIAAIKQLKL